MEREGGRESLIVGRKGGEEATAYVEHYHRSRSRHGPGRRATPSRRRGRCAGTTKRSSNRGSGDPSLFSYDDWVDSVLVLSRNS